MGRAVLARNRINVGRASTVSYRYASANENSVLVCPAPFNRVWCAFSSDFSPPDSWLPYPRGISRAVANCLVSLRCFLFRGISALLHQNQFRWALLEASRSGPTRLPIQARSLLLDAVSG